MWPVTGVEVAASVFVFDLSSSETSFLSVKSADNINLRNCPAWDLACQ